MNPDVTGVLRRLDAGETHAARELLPLVYEELRRLAAARMSIEGAAQTLQPTALVHEAWLRLTSGTEEFGWDSRGHFFAAAAESMRRILVDRARARNALKRGGDQQRLELNENAAVAAEQDDDSLLALDDALTRLTQEEPELARLVQLRYFTGLTSDETAEVMGISPRTAKRHWAYARAWLKRAMGEDDEESVEN